MPRTVDGIVACHKEAVKRRSEGRPIWDHKINIKDILQLDQSNESEEHAAWVANEIAKLIRSRVPPAWLEHGPDIDFELIEIVEGMEQLRPDSYAGDPSFTALEDLNNMLDALYDWGDENRVWLG